MNEKSSSNEAARLALIKQIFSVKHSYLSDEIIQISVQDMDDAALVKISEDQSFVIASDFIRGSGFYLFEMGYLSYYDIGYYLVVANLSDIAAMGAKPIGLTTIFRYTRDVTDQQFHEFFHGVKDASVTFDTEIVGGDIGSYTSNVFAATAFGIVKTKQALLRRNVREGDLLCVTGIIGRPITALLYFKIAKSRGFELSAEEEERILLSWRRPVARLREGMILSDGQLANACQDISDGLKATINQLSILSGRTFSVYAERLPIDQATKKLSSFLKADFLDIAVSASVDFELAFTISPEKQDICTKIFKDNGLHYTVIGEVNSSGKNLLIDKFVNVKEFPGIPWDHQHDDYLSKILFEAEKRSGDE